MKKYVIGNWKEFVQTSEKAKDIVSKIKQPTFLGICKGVLVICPPYTQIENIRGKKIKIGAQDVSQYEEGAHTGEITAKMLKDAGVKYCIVGHSETRKEGVTDEDVSSKTKALIKEDITPIICFSEEGEEKRFSEIARQVRCVFNSIDAKDVGKCIVAYEPTGHIGGERALDSENMKAASLLIKDLAREIFGEGYRDSFKVIYGGSVSRNNIERIMKEGGVDGVLVGRASTDPEEFNEIIKKVCS